MDEYGLAKKQQGPSDTFSAGDVPGDQLANLANFASGTNRKMKTCLLKAMPPYFKIISVINQRLTGKPVRTLRDCQVVGMHISKYIIIFHIYFSNVSMKK